MTIFQLECFVGVAENHSFTTASYELSISQSALSKQIGKLEDEVEAKLFDRSKRTIELTAAGQEFLEYAKKMLVTNREMLEAMRSYREVGRVVAGFVERRGQMTLIKSVTSFIDKYPKGDVDVELRHGSTWQLMDQLKAGKMDMIFISKITAPSLGTTNLDQYDLSNFEVDILTTDSYCAVVKPDHPFAKRKSISWEELTREKLVLMDKTYSLNAMVRSMFSSQDLKPDIVFECGAMETLLELCSAGFGVSIFSKQIVDSRNDSLVCVPMDPPLIRDFVLILPMKTREKRTLISRFADYVLANYEERRKNEQAMEMKKIGEREI